MKIIIRSATEADVDRITDIVNQAIPAGDAEWTETFHTPADRLTWMHSRFAAGRPVIVAARASDDTPESSDEERDVTPDDVIGLASYGDFRESTCREGFRFVCEHSVYVDENARGSGVATMLMNELESLARQNGLRWMVATIDAINERSIEFHRRRGFVEVGRMPDIGFTFDTWRTMVLMQLDLGAANDG